MKLFYIKKTLRNLKKIKGCTLGLLFKMCYVYCHVMYWFHQLVGNALSLCNGRLISSFVKSPSWHLMSATLCHKIFWGWIRHFIQLYFLNVRKNGSAQTWMAIHQLWRKKEGQLPGLTILFCRYISFFSFHLNCYFQKKGELLSPGKDCWLLT